MTVNPEPIEAEPAKGKSWLRAEFERAKRRNALIPRSARPVVAIRPEPRTYGCTCGHPGSGCSCPPSNWSRPATTGGTDT